MHGKDNLVRIVVVDDGVCHELGLTNNLWKYATCSTVYCSTTSALGRSVGVLAKRQRPNTTSTAAASSDERY